MSAAPQYPVQARLDAVTDSRLVMYVTGSRVSDIYSAHPIEFDKALKADVSTALNEVTQQREWAAEALTALLGAVGALEFNRDYHADLGNEEQAFCQDKLDAVTKAIAKATGGAS